MTTDGSSTMTSSLKWVSTLLRSVLESSKKRLNNYIFFQICYNDNFINIAEKTIKKQQELKEFIIFFNLLTKDEIMNRYKTFSFEHQILMILSCSETC